MANQWYPSHLAKKLAHTRILILNFSFIFTVQHFILATCYTIMQKNFNDDHNP